jgi:hypothetical protein
MPSQRCSKYRLWCHGRRPCCVWVLRSNAPINCVCPSHQGAPNLIGDTSRGVRLFQLFRTHLGSSPACKALHRLSFSRENPDTLGRQRKKKLVSGKSATTDCPHCAIFIALSLSLAPIDMHQVPFASCRCEAEDFKKRKSGSSRAIQEHLGETFFCSCWHPLIEA